MSTTYLAGLLALGFIMLMIGWPWWLGIGLIVLTMAVALSGGEEPAQQPMAAAKAFAAKPSAAGPKATGEEGFDVDDMKWSPTTFADGMMGVNPMKSELGGAVGARSGAFTQDMGPIRFKDDLRFRVSEEDSAFDMCRAKQAPSQHGTSGQGRMPSRTCTPHPRRQSSRPTT
jgi:hypothetical protein